jgi:hypothetical protein
VAVCDLHGGEARVITAARRIDLLEAIRQRYQALRSVSRDERRSLEIEIRALAEQYKATTEEGRLARRVNPGEVEVETPHRRYG